MDTIFTLLLGLHIALGGLALATGSLVLLLAKGDRRHKQLGKIFYYSLLIASLVACIIAVLPKHQNIFLFCIGLLTLYLLIAGYRALGFRQKNPDLSRDKLLALTLGLIGLVLISFPIILYQKTNYITAGFGVACLYFGLSDLRLYRRPKVLQAEWLQQHLGKMTGAYLASVTAFFVVNNILLVPMWNWFAPGIFGGVWIAFYNRKLRKDKATAQ
jgi:uncharacterized membrane protein